MRIKAIVMTVALAANSFAAFAHDVAKGPNGGQITEDAGHHIEFTTKDDAVVLYLTDAADGPLATKGSTGRVIVQDGAVQVSADLAAVEPNQMAAKIASPLKAGAKVVVSIKMTDGHDLKARFVVK
jgi:hypothetical protein